MKEKDWNKLASGMLEAELKRKNIGYGQLISLLDRLSIKEIMP